jgi:pantoate--beta-alanine ligase
MIQPDRAYFGRKDYQQLQVIRQMARDLDFPLEIVPCDTVREPDGLAMSSRNRYLSPGERQSALALSRSLTAAHEAFTGGERGAASLAETARDVLRQEPGVETDYVYLVDAETLLPIQRVQQPAVLLIAARVGTTRLIDNTVLG